MTDKEHLKRAGLRGCDADFLDSDANNNIGTVRSEADGRVRARSSVSL
jgi:hypothetical protein